MDDRSSIRGRILFSLPIWQMFDLEVHLLLINILLGLDGFFFFKIYCWSLFRLDVNLLFR